tara:strand:+ start:242 stop:1915 length:1674 start_codon:yes stop_codon:yes gene_type:complete
MEVVGLCSLMAALTTARRISGSTEDREESRDSGTDTDTDDRNEILTVNTELIIDDVIAGKAMIEKPTSENTLSFFSVEEKESYLDDFRELKGLCTDIITTEFLKSESNIHFFVDKVVSLFEEAISIYCQKKGIVDDGSRIIFLYKSGNILRLLSQHFLNYMPHYDILRNEMEQYFKKGDCDFCIYINPNDISQHAFDQIHTDMTNIAFILNVHLREIFMNSLPSTFSFMNFKKSFQNSVLERFVEKTKSLDCFSDESNTALYNKKVNSIRFLSDDKYACPDDQHISFTSSSMSNIVVNSVGTNDDNFIYVQCNRALHFYKTTTDIAHFNLIRSKINFNIEIEDVETGETEDIDVGGELIDVSIPHYNDKKVGLFFKNIKKNTHPYVLHNDSLPDLKFTGISLTYNILDLEEQIFGSGKITESSSMPWEMKKYEKRIHRLLFMYFMDIFRNKKIKTMKKMDTCIKLLAELTQKLAQMVDIQKWVTEFRGVFENVMILDFFSKLNEIREHLLQTNYEPFADMLQLIISDLMIFDMTIHNNKHFCNKNNRIYFTEDLYVS